MPDTAVRVFVLDFDSLPSKAAEALPVLRFRLRKMIPFDVEHAGLSYQVLTESKNECRVLAAVLPGPVLAEYEAVARMAGYEPGAVLPTSLAALGAIDSDEPVLAANLSALALTTSIAQGQDLLLYRTLDLPEEPEQRLAEVQRGIAVAAAYYEDKLGVRPQLLYYAGIGAGGDSSAEDFARWIDDAESDRGRSCATAGDWRRDASGQSDEPGRSGGRAGGGKLTYADYSQSRHTALRQSWTGAEAAAHCDGRAGGGGIGLGLGLRAIDQKARRRAPPRIACRADRRDQPGTAGLHEQDARAGQRPIACPGGDAQPALRRKDILLDAGDGRLGDGSCRAACR